MTPQELVSTRKSLGLTVAAMAERLNTPYRTYLKWERGERRVPGMLDVAIKQIRRDNMTSVSFYSRENNSGPFEYLCEEGPGGLVFAETRGLAEAGRRVEEVFPEEEYSTEFE